MHKLDIRTGLGLFFLICSIIMIFIAYHVGGWIGAGLYFYSVFGFINTALLIYERFKYPNIPLDNYPS